MKVTDEQATIHRPWSMLITNREYGYILGIVVTQLGVVNVYSQGGESSARLTSFRVVKDGVLHIRQINKRYTKRGLVTLANRFAKEVFDR